MQGGAAHDSSPWIWLLKKSLRFLRCSVTLAGAMETYQSSHNWNSLPPCCRRCWRAPAPLRLRTAAPIPIPSDKPHHASAQPLVLAQLSQPPPGLGSLATLYCPSPSSTVFSADLELHNRPLPRRAGPNSNRPLCGCRSTARTRSAPHGGRAPRQPELSAPRLPSFESQFTTHHKVRTLGIVLTPNLSLAPQVEARSLPGQRNCCSKVMMWREFPGTVEDALDRTTPEAACNFSR